MVTLFWIRKTLLINYTSMAMSIKWYMSVCRLLTKLSCNRRDISTMESLLRFVCFSISSDKPPHGWINRISNLVVHWVMWLHSYKIWLPSIFRKMQYL